MMATGAGIRCRWHRTGKEPLPPSPSYPAETLRSAASPGSAGSAGQGTAEWPPQKTVPCRPLRFPARDPEPAAAPAILRCRGDPSAPRQRRAGASRQTCPERTPCRRFDRLPPHPVDPGRHARARCRSSILSRSLLSGRRFSPAPFSEAPAPRRSRPLARSRPSLPPSAARLARKGSAGRGSDRRVAGAGKASRSDSGGTAGDSGGQRGDIRGSCL